MKRNETINLASGAHKLSLRLLLSFVLEMPKPEQGCSLWKVRELWAGSIRYGFCSKPTKGGQRGRRLKTSCWRSGFRIPSGREDCETSSRIILAPNSDEGSVIARIFRNSCFIELLMAPQDWRKWLCECFYRPVSSESHADESGRHETLILFQENLQRNYFGLIWVLGHLRPSFLRVTVCPVLT